MPTYHGMGDHSETVQVVFDPAQISYDELLNVFWSLHNPSSRPYLVQYRNAIFYTDDEQRQASVASKKALATTLGKTVNTAIEKAGIFTPAEDYHQKHSLKRVKPVLDILRKRYPDQQQLFLSTDAARLNGFIGCNGDPAQLGTELRKLKLPVNLEQELFDSLVLTCRSFNAGGCSLPAVSE